MNCAECKDIAVVGSRCIQCWVNRHARNIGISEYKWFKQKREYFAALLRGRWIAIVNGAAPGPMDEIIQFFYGPDPRPQHDKRCMDATKRKLTMFVNLFDENIRRKYGSS